MDATDFPSLVSRSYRILREMQPIQGEYDVAWSGPFYIPRSGEWYATHFSLYNGTLYGGLRKFLSASGFSFHLVTGRVEFFKGWNPGGYFEEDEWNKAIVQVLRRLESATKNLTRYNRFVARTIPLSCRTGKIQRKLTWPKNLKSAIPRAEIERAKRAMSHSGDRPMLREMTKGRYLKIAALAYDACCKELRGLSAPEKYRRKADFRHGGLLDLPDGNAERFLNWIQSKEWTGKPWLIIPGNRIRLAPHYDRVKGGWSFTLCVDSESGFATSVKIALALYNKSIPFEFYEGESVLQALEGIDDVSVGPDFRMVSYEELSHQKPEVVKFIRWDPINELHPIQEDQRARVLRAEQEH